MACSGAYATANDYAIYYCVSLDDSCAAQLSAFLKLAAGGIHAARQASDQCDCDLAAWAVDYLKELNLLLALRYNCPCVKPLLSDEAKAAMMEAAHNDLIAIRNGEIQLCSGTGTAYPAFGTAEIAWTEFATAQIIANAADRDT